MTLRTSVQAPHRRASGPTFYQLHLLFDKHFNEQGDLVDGIAERIAALAASASPCPPT